MAWSNQQRKAHSARLKAAWAKKKAEIPVAVSAEAEFQVDMVNRPPHYTFGKYEPADVADDWYGTEPLLWNANKYIARWDKKGDAIENLEKAIWYLSRKIGQLKGGRS